MRKLVVLAAASVAAIGFSTAAQAQLQVLGYFPHNGAECSGGGFSGCFASLAGVNVTGDNESSVIYKNGIDGEDFGPYPSIDGTEFDVNLDPTTNHLTFTYTPDDLADPAIHYFAIFQGGDPVGGAKNSGPGYELFYDALGITSGDISLSTYFQNPGFSHISFFNGERVGVPEPGTWAMMLLGFGVAGFAMRRSRRRKAQLLQLT